MYTPLHFAEQIETKNFLTIGNASEPCNNYKFIKGQLVLSGRQPDGDSVAFLSDDPGAFKDLYRSYLLKPSTRDGSVQLRFEGIDAPELHYGSAMQPLGEQARDFLLEKILGFQPVYKPSSNPDHPATTVDHSVPPSVRAVIASNALEPHGRPISYIFLSEVGYEDGTTGPLSEDQLRLCVNYRMLEEGFAYLLAYTSMPDTHYQVFKQAADKARSQKKQIWTLDATRDFVLSGLSSVEGSDAQLIFPKLFRRCVDFFKSGEKDLKQWLQKNDSENDRVRITETATVTFDSLIDQVNDHVSFQADTNDIIFIEK